MNETSGAKNTQLKFLFQNFIGSAHALCLNEKSVTAIAIAVIKRTKTSFQIDQSNIKIIIP